MPDSLHKPLLSLPSVRKDLIAKNYMQQGDLDTQVQDKWYLYRHLNHYGKSPYLPYEPLTSEDDDSSGGETPEQPNSGTWNVTNGTFSEDAGILTHDGIGTISVSLIGGTPEVPVAFAQRTELFKVGDTISYEVQEVTRSKAKQLSFFAYPLFLETGTILSHPVSNEDWNNLFIEKEMGGSPALIMAIMPSIYTQMDDTNVEREHLTLELRVAIRESLGRRVILDATRFPLKLTITKQASRYLIGYQYFNGVQEVIVLDNQVDGVYDLYPTLTLSQPVQLLNESEILQ